jgi:2-hydroxy-6-oxonona-2,4-dienedioate hydrolase
VVEMRGCDHWAQYEQPVAFNEASIAFLRSQP